MLTTLRNSQCDTAPYALSNFKLRLRGVRRRSSAQPRGYAVIRVYRRYTLLFFCGILSILGIRYGYIIGFERCQSILILERGATRYTQYTLGEIVDFQYWIEPLQKMVFLFLPYASSSRLRLDFKYCSGDMVSKIWCRW